MCDKCKGTGMFEDAKCDKCGGTKVVKTETVEKQVAQAHAAAADAHAAAAQAAAVDDDPKAADDHADAADDHADEAEDAADEESDQAADEEDTAEDDHPEAKKVAKGKKGVNPFKKKSLKISEQDGKFVLTRKGTVLGTHNTLEAAEAQKTAMVGKTEEMPWEIRKAHDWTCAAYKAADVVEEYPTIATGGAINKATKDAVFASLTKAIKDGDSEDIVNLGMALGAITDLLAAQASKADGIGDMYLGAREDLTVAFKAENPQIGDLPKPSESIEPGQFKRPYISAGHQSESGSAKAPHIPETTHPIRATDFSRGPLTAGHQRYLATKMAAFHDAIVAVHPDLCRMDVNGSNAFDRQPAASFDRTMLSGKQVPNQDTASPKSVNPSAPSTIPAVKSVSVTGDLAVKTYTQAELDEAVSSHLQPLLEKVESIEAQYNELAAQPDPNRSALRGVTGITSTKISQATVKKAAQKAARKTKRADKIDYFRLLAASPDSATRIHAQDRLSQMGVDPN